MGDDGGGRVAAARVTIEIWCNGERHETEYGTSTYDLMNLVESLSCLDSIARILESGRMRELKAVREFNVAIRELVERMEE